MSNGRSELIVTDEKGNVRRLPLMKDGKPLVAGDLTSGAEYRVYPDGTVTLERDTVSADVCPRMDDELGEIVTPEDTGQ